MMRVRLVRLFGFALCLLLPLRLPADTSAVQKQFVAAIRRGDLAQVKALLDKGAKINTGRKYKPSADKTKVNVPDGPMTPLMEAAKNGRANIVRFLIQRGARLEDEEGVGMLTALMYAKNYASVKALLDAGANPNTVNIDGEPVLLNWVGKRNAEAKRTTRLLLERGAKADTGDVGGISALIYAVEAGDISIIRLLLQKGAKPNSSCEDESIDEEEETALSLAKRKKRADIVRLLKQYGARK